MVGILQTLVDKYKAAKQKSLDKKTFKEALLQAVEDGKLTDEEISDLDHEKADLGLTDEDIKGIRAEIYTAAFTSAKSDKQVTKEEEVELEKIQKFLGLSDNDIEPDKKELARLRLLNEIQNGNMPAVYVSNIVLLKDEKTFWAEPSDFIEEKTLRHRYEGGSSGVSFRIMKGVSYRVGSSRGYIMAEKGWVVTSSGDLIITNKRIIFKGDRKSFDIKLNKILSTENYTNALVVSESGKQTAKTIKFKQPGNQDIIGATLSYAINHFES